ncbi:MAG: hypothetical protein HAW66_10020 [Shewanella sp.]|nr:hypothetical protein [Shewanella sp.]
MTTSIVPAGPQAQSYNDMLLEFAERATTPALSGFLIAGPSGSAAAIGTVFINFFAEKYFLSDSHRVNTYIDWTMGRGLDLASSVVVQSSMANFTTGNSLMGEGLRFNLNVAKFVVPFVIGQPVALTARTIIGQSDKCGNSLVPLVSSAFFGGVGAFLVAMFEQDFF